MLMLQTVMRPSMVRPRTVEPRYSTRCPCPNEMPVRPMRPRTTSLAVTPSGRSPSTVTARSRAWLWGRHCVAKTSSTSDVPMPNASAPNAPWVGRCDLVHKMQVDVEEIRLAWLAAHHVRVPQLLAKGPWSIHLRDALPTRGEGKGWGDGSECIRERQTLPAPEAGRP